MRNLSLVVLTGTAILAVTPAFGAAAPGLLETALGKMDEAAKSFRGLSGEIRKASHTAVINESTTDEGTILVKRLKPRDLRMLIDFKKPDPKTIAFAGRKVEIFLPKMNTVQEYDVKDEKQRKLMDQYLLLGFGSTSADLKSNYTMKATGQETVAGQKTIRIELIPTSKEALVHLKRVELWISESSGLPAQQKFHMSGGDYNLATYSNVKVNPDLPDSALKLNLPKGVKRETPLK